MIAAERSLTCTELLRRRAEETPDGIATFHRTPVGAWRPTTWATMWREVQQAAATLRSLGVERGDRLAILAPACREWQVAELGALLAGAAVLGVDPGAAAEQVAWLLEDAGAVGLVVDGPHNLAKVPEWLRDRLKFIVMFDADSVVGSRRPIHAWGTAMSALAVAPLAEVPVVSPADSAMVIYTSGTTGTPKGIEYSHAQLTTACWAMLEPFPDFAGSRLICWLPMAALFQRMMNLLAVASCSTTYFVDDPREIMARVAEIRPTVFTSVPRFYQKLHDGIQAQLALQSGMRKRLIEAALAAGGQWSAAMRTNTRPRWALRVRHAIFDRLVLRRMRAVMGGEIKWMISGSAATPTWLLEFFHSIGLLLLEAYGISENPVPIAANRPYAFRFGSVGKPFALNEIRLADDSEVLVKGPAMFRGYLGDGADDRFTSNGYYRTGDYGRFDSDGFLYLTGRVAELIKTSTGRRISPSAIEAVYGRSRYVDQIVVVGNDRPYLCALVVANSIAVDGSRDIHDLIRTDFTSLGASLARHERVRAFVVLSSPFSVEKGEMTVTLKPRRGRIEANYRDIIDTMYDRTRAPAFELPFCRMEFAGEHA